MSGKGFIAAESDGECKLCGTIAETRPYGPNEEEICFDCAQKNPEITRKQMHRFLFGEGEPLIRKAKREQGV